MLIKEITEYLKKRYPEELASDFDKNRIGLIIGDENFTLKNIMFALDLKIEVLEEAIEKDCNFIIVHHPFIFEPLYKILFSSEKGQIINLMYKHQISLYVMHTNLDVAMDGINDTLAELLEINYVKTEPTKDEFIRYGEIRKMNLYEVVNLVKVKFNLTGVRVAGDLNRLITKVGIVGGAGEIEIQKAIDLQLDCFITSEVKLHNVQYAILNNLSIIEVNHGIEKLVYNKISKSMEEDLQLFGKTFISNFNTDPFTSI